MRISQPHPALSEMTRGQRLWGYLKESTVTELRYTLRILVAPIHALRAGSLEPIQSVISRSLDEGDQVFDRYWPSRRQ